MSERISVHSITRAHPARLLHVPALPQAAQPSPHSSASQHPPAALSVRSRSLSLRTLSEAAPTFVTPESHPVPVRPVAPPNGEGDTSPIPRTPVQLVASADTSRPDSWISVSSTTSSLVPSPLLDMFDSFPAVPDLPPLPYQPDIHRSNDRNEVQHHASAQQPHAHPDSVPRYGATPLGRSSTTTIPRLHVVPASRQIRAHP